MVFVGLEAYQHAGGAIRQDLFSEDDTGYVLDVALLNRLVAEKLETIRAEIAAEGWRWVEAVADLGWEDLRQFSRRYPERLTLTKKQQKELDRLSDQYDELVDSDEEANTDRLEQIEQRIAELNALAEKWSADTLSLAGAIVSLDHDGSVTVERGLVRKEDLRDAEKADQDESGDEATPSPRAGIPPRLIQDLTAQKSAAIGAELMGQPNVALTAVVHCLALGPFTRAQAPTAASKCRAGLSPCAAP